MIITREIFDSASPEQLRTWIEHARWWYFTFEVVGAEGNWAMGQWDKWWNRINPIEWHIMRRIWGRMGTVHPAYPHLPPFIPDEVLDWLSRAETMFEAAGRPPYPPPLSGENKE